MRDIEVRQRKIKRVRDKILGTGKRPRVAVFRSNKRISVQAIDDEKGVTVAFANDENLAEKLTKSEKAKKIGEKLGEKLTKVGIKTAVFDKRYYKYHGRVKALADGIREKGVVF